MFENAVLDKSLVLIISVCIKNESIIPLYTYVYLYKLCETKHYFSNIFLYDLKILTLIILFREYLCFIFF